MVAERAQPPAGDAATPLAMTGGATSDLWAEIAQPAPSDAGHDIWRALDDRLDLGNMVATPNPGVVVRGLTGRDGQRSYVARSPSRQYLHLDAADLALWERMDGRTTARTIAVTQFVERGEFVAERLARLLQSLRDGGFVQPGPVDCFAMVRERGRRSLLGSLTRLVIQAFSAPLARFHDPDRPFGAAYRAGGWLLFSPLARALWPLVVVVGMAIWWLQFSTGTHALLQTHGSYRLGFVVLTVLDSVGLSLYALIQGLALKRHGHRVPEAGVTLSGVIPVVYVDTSDAWLAERRDRLAITWAGPYGMLILSAALAILSLPLAGTELGATLFKGATIWLANTIFNLLPVIDSAGYLMLADYLELPGLRARANEFMQHGLRASIAAGRRLSRDERVYVAFGMASILTYLLIPVAILEARDLRYAAAIQELWERPQPGARLLAVAMILLFLGPSTVSLLHRLVGLIVLAAAPVWRRLRTGVPAEHVALLAALPFLRTFSRSDLLQIARHLERRRAPAGTTLIRQGAAPDRFYLLQSGSVLVTKMTADGQSVTLARLGPGDHFGETALLADVPRTASVIAETDVRLLSLRGGQVRRWLVGRQGATDLLRRSLAERDRLMALPFLQGLSAAEIDRLAGRMLVTRYLPGDEIVRQGDAGDRFYIVVEGSVEVVRETSGTTTRLAVLGPGDYFGELALLNRAPRSATVRALSAVETYTLSDADFGELMACPPAARALRSVAAQRAWPATVGALLPAA